MDTKTRRAAAADKGQKRTRSAPLAGLDTSASEPDDSGPQPGDAPTATAAPPLTRLQLVTRRLKRTREAVAAVASLQTQLLERLREHHRRFALRHGHAGNKDGAAAVATAAEALGLAAPGVCCAAPPAAAPSTGAPTGQPPSPCTAPPLPLSPFCLRHILLDPRQLAYVADTDGEPRLRKPGDAPPAVAAAPAVVQVPVEGGDMGGDTRAEEGDGEVEDVPPQMGLRAD
jgi:hypothetical protein